MDVLGSDDDEASSGDESADGDTEQVPAAKPKAIDLETLERCGYTCVSIAAHSHMPCIPSAQGWPQRTACPTIQEHKR